jgi:hypothetical protein|tara:strand:- start:1023 stop:2966 length:1944 start_codon:yes stop_codon:yes gene_type:complete
MPIKKYIANADNTITDAYNNNLSTRATGSNMGAADVAEVFHIYGQQSSASQEYSRALYDFPITSISTDRTAGTVPASGTVSFYLRLFNTPHASTIPRDATYTILPVSRSWEEGYGLDMESYSNLTYEGTGSNWDQANSTFVQATASLTTIATANTGMNNLVMVLSGTDGTSYTTTCDTSVNIGAADATTIGLADMNSAAKLAQAIYYSLTSALAADTVPISASWDGSSAVVNLYQTSHGQYGNTHINGALVDGTNYVTGTVGSGSVISFYSGSQFTAWTNAGGDYHDQNLNAGVYNVSMQQGNEDIELDITALVEDWIKGESDGGIDNYGVLLKLTSSQESGGLSQYTKKFFARTSQYFFKRPCIEARWDDSTFDNRGDFYFSSSIAPADDNVNTLYLYNYIRGSLQEIPGLTDKVIYVSLYSGSDTNVGPDEQKLLMSVTNGAEVAAAGDYNATGGIISTGIYTASICLTGTSALTRVFDVWHDGVNSKPLAHGGTEYHTGSSKTNTFDAFNFNPDLRLVGNVTDLQPVYHVEQKTTRFRLFLRPKNWNPNIYSKAYATLPSYPIQNVYYSLVRTSDQYPVIAYGTGTDHYGNTANDTKLSFDETGSYFDLDVSMLETDYGYTMRFLYYINGKYVESNEEYKFRVE